MRIDLYTRIVLTVIAVCLLVLAVQHVPIVPPAHAADVPKVQIVGTPSFKLHSDTKDGLEPVLKVQLVGIRESKKLGWEWIDVWTLD
jgi:hypothetical protein